MAKILEKRVLNESVTMLKLDAPAVAKKAQAGQFIILRVDERGERIPLTIADFDREEGSVTIIFQKVGLSTQLLGEMNEGDDVLDFVGPLGIPTHVPEGAKKICVVGGGVGCAIAFPQAKFLTQAGYDVDVIVGFRSKDLIILEDEFRANSTNLYLCTDDGSYGRKALVTEPLKENIEAGANYDLVIAIGPVPMMKFVCKTTEPHQIKTLVSLNPIMVDGTGMCGCCRVTVDGKIQFACVDGPDFDGHLVDFDELVGRNAAYREREAHDCENLSCRMKTLGAALAE